MLNDYRLGDGINGMDVIRSVKEVLNRHVDAALITGNTASRHCAMLPRAGSRCFINRWTLTNSVSC